MSSSKSRRAGRPYVRKGLVNSAGGGAGAGASGAGAAARLAKAAGGKWGGGQPSVDALEPRKLLFSLTIGPGDIDPTTGLGTRTATFGYFIPYLFKEVPEADESEPVVEEFEDEDAPWTEQVPATPPSGFFFNESQIQISYSGIGALVELIPGPDPGVDDDLDLQTTLSGNGTTTFSFFTGEGNAPPAPRQTDNAQFVIRGLDTSATGTKVELLRGGQVVLTLSGAALAAVGTPVIGGNLRFDFNYADILGGFDAVRFSSAQSPPDNVAYIDTFIIDDISYTPPSTQFAEFTSGRIFGAQVVFTGPVGATAQFLDLYGREMVATIALGIPEGAEQPIATPIGGPIPAFNDGIGRINISGTNASTSLTMWGGTIDTAPGGGFQFNLPDSIMGLYDDFEEAGFGYALTNEAPPSVIGLPPGSGSVIIGSPIVRPLTSAGDYLGPLIGFEQQVYSTFGIGAGGQITNDALFRSPDQGIRVANGNTIGSLLVHGLIHGSSRFTGAVGRLSLGTLLGSVTIDGDAGTIAIASDAGHYAREDAPAAAAPVPYADDIFDTRNEIIVGRTLGEILIGGRSTMDVTVIADVNNIGRARLDFLQYRELEQFHIDPPATVQGYINSLLGTNPIAAPGVFGSQFTRFDGQAIPFGTGTFRNDSILSAEYVGHNATAVIIDGHLGDSDLINTGFDAADVYAFSAGPESVVTFDILLDYIAALGLNPGIDVETLAYARIVDADGRVLVSHEVSSRSRSRVGNGSGVRMTFEAEHADVYYLVLNTPVEGANPYRDVPYQVAITGMLPTTFGGYRSGASTGYDPVGFAGPAVSISTQAGSMGLVRVGTGFVAPAGTEADPTDLINTVEDVDDLLSLRPASFNVAGSLHGVMIGSDVYGVRADTTPGPQFSIGGNLGSFRTGMSAVVGVGPTQGDVLALHLNVGGTIAVFDVNGSIRFNQDVGAAAPLSSAVNIRTGIAGGRGDIGLFSVGQTLNGENVNIRTSPGSTIDAFLVGEGGGIGDIDERNPFFNLGVGSDVRFASFSRIESGTDPDAFRPLLPGVPITLTDDSGGVVTIEIRGGSLASAGQVRILPINGSQGVAIGRIDATLLGGASLVINGVNGGRAAIGRIVLTTDEDTARSSVQIGGSGEIDVWRIEHIEGDPLLRIENTTERGDIVAIDVQGVDEVHIRRGSLGRTETSGAGPRLLGPFLGVNAGYVTDTGGAIGLNPASVNPAWNGQLYAPIRPTTSDQGTDETLSDLGGPFGPSLNGLLVREGGVQRVTAGGAIGDIILQGGNLGAVTANADSVRPFGAFEGIVGVIYATNIGSVDVGDGLAGPGRSSIASAGIFADNGIGDIIAGRGLSPVISGIILAANSDPDPANTIFPGLNRVRVINGLIDNAFIGSATFDSFWTSARFFNVGLDTDDPEARGQINSILGEGSNLFRSEVYGAFLNEIRLEAGAYDATRTVITGDINRITADQFRNTTRLGEILEYRPNEIRATRNINTITTSRAAGDITDLRIDAQGSLTGSVTARNLVRMDLDIDGTISSISAGKDILASAVRAGSLSQAAAVGNIRSSSFRVAGLIDRITAGMNMTSVDILSDGPDGRINTITAALFLTGDISSSGPIGQIVSTLGDIIATVKTTDADGTLGLLQAANDVRVTLDVNSNVDRIIAGRNIGLQGDENTSRAINIRGNLNMIMANTGQIYTDVRVGQGINIIQQARVLALPGADFVSRAVFHAFGRINTVNIFGDFNGSIISESGGIGIVTITDGSFRPGNRIQANDGGIDQVVIVGGHLMGDIISEEFINAVRVLPNAVGFWGDIGVNPNLSQSVPFDGMRNQLPPGVAPDPSFQGANIRAGTNIGLVEVANASMWESSIYAGHSVGRVFVFGAMLNDFVTPGLGGSWIAAGDSIGVVEVNQFVGGAFILAGLTNLGADGRPGGIGANADTVQFGRIGDVILRGGSGLVSIAAGMNAGPDGFYTLNPGPDGVRGTADDINDDAVADGLSSIGSVTVLGAALQTTAYADNGIGATSAGIIRGGPGLKQQNPGRIIEFVPTSGQLVPGVATPFVLPSGETGRITFSGPGQAYYEQVFDETLGRTIGRFAVINSTLASSLIVDTDQGTLTDLRITSNDGSSLGFASVRGNMLGASSFYFDAYVQFAEFGAINTAGVIGAGNDMGSLVVGPTSKGRISANYINQVVVGGTFGDPAGVTGAVIDLLAGGRIDVLGNLSGVVSLKRDVAALAVAGAINRGVVRSGRGLTDVFAGSMDNGRISARNDITRITVAGNVVDSFIYAGADIGPDGVIGTADDFVSTGNIATVAIGGNFVRSDIAAGIARGQDGFLGTPDDKRSSGRSTIGSVVIAGQALGSELNSQSYRIISTGAIGSVTASGRPLVSAGNLAVAGFDASADPLRVLDLIVTEESGVYTASIQFNQLIDSSTLSPSLTIAEIRDGGIAIALAQGIDYFVEYNAATNTANIRFSRELTTRNLPARPGVPGPGVFRFVLDSDVIRGQTQDTRIDGNADGFAAPTDDFSQDAIVGDAGDKLVAGRADAGNGNFIDFYGATNLNLVLDNNYTPDGLPDPNKVFTIRGTIGDHPDHDVDFFRFSGDADVLKINLRAGQILRLGEMQGNASLAARVLLDSEGTPLLINQGGLASLARFAGFQGFQAFSEFFEAQGLSGQKFLRLPDAVPDRDSISSGDQILIKETGTYYILVTSTVSGFNLGATDELPDVTDPTQIPNIGAVAGATGAYNFTLEVFDDGDSGFSGDTDSGDGSRLVPAPLPIAFAGADGVFGTGDDQGSVSAGSFLFFLDRGPDGLPNTADDLVRGSSGSGITSQRTAGPDGLFGTVDDELITFVGASIGRPTPSGVPQEITPDVDVYHLNNRDPIAPGTKVRATLRLTDLGANLGVTQQPRIGEDRPDIVDLRGNFQFAVFETSGSVGIDDALLLAAPSEALPIGGQAQKTFARGDTSYGYDANGDFFIDFVVPGRQGIGGTVPASYALYIQGSIRSDYELVIVQQGVGVTPPVSQNVYIETRGGIIDWLEVGGISTTLAPFSASPLGFTGLIGAERVDDYVVSRLVSNLDAIFAAANVDVRFSTNSNQFEGQSFSTVFLTRTSEPNAFALNDTFGASQRADAFNLDLNDQAVVFAPSLSLLGHQPSQAGADALVQSLTTAVARRVGELVGLRALGEASGAGVVPTMASNSVNLLSGAYRFNNGSAQLSNNWDSLYDSNFFLGRQNDVTLLDRILADRF